LLIVHETGAAAYAWNVIEFAESFSVDAVMPGPDAADELFIYIAHWDHLGTTAHEEA